MRSTRVLDTMIVLHAATGEGITMLRLRQACDGKVRMLSLQYPSLETVLDSGYSFEHLLDDLVRQVQELQADGPVRLTGYSWGGFVAYSLALRLIDLGRSVCFLALLDTPWAIEAVDGLSGKQRLQGFLYKVGSYSKANALARRAARLAFLSKNRSFLRWAHAWSRKRGRIAMFRSLFEVHLTIEVFAGLSATASELFRSSPRVVQFPVFLFRSQEHPAAATEDLGWADVCLDLQIVQVPGGHRLCDPQAGDVMYPEYLAAVEISTPEAAYRCGGAV